MRPTQSIEDRELARHASAVLARYPLPATSVPHPLDQPGGFSGAVLWRLESAAGPAYLRAWPPTESAERLRWIHGLMEQARLGGLSFVPGVFASHTGDTVIEQAGRCWEVGTWMPGRADYHAHPSPARLAAAGRALAQVHLAWAYEATSSLAPIPAILRRQQALLAVIDHLNTTPTMPAVILDPTQAILRRATALLYRWLPGVPDALARWTTRAYPLQPCLCDPWHDHVLYEGDTVTGLVDYGAALLDHPAVDLARLLGSLAADNDWSPALAGYRSVRRFTDEEETLARTLDRSGTLLAIGRWLQRLGGGADRAQAMARVEVLVQRVEAW